MSLMIAHRYADGVYSLACRLYSNKKRSNISNLLNNYTESALFNSVYSGLVIYTPTQVLLISKNISYLYTRVSNTKKYSIQLLPRNISKG